MAVKPSNPVSKREKSAPIPHQSAQYSALWPGIALLVILGLTWFLYQPALKNGFTNWDDQVYVTENADLKWNPEGLKALASKEVAGNFHPLTMWSLAFDARGSNSPDPRPFHATNIWLHLLNTALAFALALRLRANWIVAAVAALFFAMHPMHVESVAWVSARKDVLYTAFFLAGLLSFTYARQAPSRSGQVGFWVLTFGCFVLSALAKPAALIFPAVILLLDGYLNEGAFFNKKTILKTIPFWAAALVLGILTLRYQKAAGAVDEVYFSFFHKLLFACTGLTTYVWKAIWPGDLAAFHPVPAREALQTADYLPGVAGALAFGAALVYAFFKNKTWFFGLAFFLLNVVLVLGFVKVGSAVYAERYTYLSYWGLFFLAGVGVNALIKSGAVGKIAGIGLVVGFAAFFAMGTARQIPVWKNSETLWTQIIAQHPIEKCLQYRGFDRYLAGKYQLALEDFDRAYAQNPADPTTLHIRSICLQKLGKNEAATESFAALEQSGTANAEAMVHYGDCLMALQKHDLAIEKYTKAVTLNPALFDAWNNRASAYFFTKQYDKALEGFQKAVEINPKSEAALKNRGACYLYKSDWKAALADFDASLAIQPAQPEVYYYRSLAYDRLGNKAAAARELEEAKKRGYRG